MALPAETGPVLAPDRLSAWPVEGARYGLDATYYGGATGFERADLRSILVRARRDSNRRDENEPGPAKTCRPVSLPHRKLTRKTNAKKDSTTRKTSTDPPDPARRAR